MEIVRTLVHKFNIADVEDPVLYAGFPLAEFEKSELGEWCRVNTEKPIEWTLNIEQGYYQGYVGKVFAFFNEKTATAFNLKADIK